MKKIILILTLGTLFLSCKEETREKVKAATKAVSTDASAAAKIAKEKVYKTIDTAKVKAKAKKILEKGDRKSTRLNSSHSDLSRMPSSA